MLAALALLAVLAAPGLDPVKASRILAARNLGLAQLEEGKKEARATFARLAELAPEEPIGWADGAVAALREGDLAGAEKLLARADEAGGKRADLFAIRAAIEEARNKPEAARAALAQAAALDARDLEPRWRLVRSLDAEQRLLPAQKQARVSALREILAASPANLPARLKLLVLTLEAGEAAAKEELAALEPLLADAEARPKQLLAETKTAIADSKQASIKARLLENLLRVTPRYQQSLGELFTNVKGLPLTSFSQRLEAELRPRPGAGVPVSFQESKLVSESPEALLNRVDLANTGKLEVYRPPAPYREAAFLDADLDGDLDVYLFGAPESDRLLRNNLDDTFTDVTAATGEPAFRSKKAIPVDLDRDGDPDLLAITADGELVVRQNLRQGRFKTVPLGVSHASDADVADVNGDGAPDVVVAASDGVHLLLNKGDGTFTVQKVAAAPADARLVLLADLDNDGFPDLVAAGASSIAILRNTGGTFTAWLTVSGAAPDRVVAVDVDKDGDLDLVVSRGGRTSVLENRGGNANAWLDVVLEGLATGSGKVNRQGIGSLVEVKAGDLYVARTVGLPAPLHFGLGARGKADVVRAVFTNGVPQNVFDQRAKTLVKEVQQLKGSCPFVYAYDGEAGVWSFVSDALGRAPLGLLYDGVHLAGADTREWLALPRGALAPTKEGKLLLDYTEELWEVAFLDEATLLAVDHPDGTRIVPNERTVPEPLERKLFTATHPRPVRRALSTVRGRAEDVTERLRRADSVYVSPGPETRYQGVRAKHTLELDLGPVAPGDRVVLFLTGWIFYTDTSINVSLSQRKDVPHFPPVLEVPDGTGGPGPPKTAPAPLRDDGGWKVGIPNFGFPAGKTKTMPVDLTGILVPADPRVRIRTTMAVFWDEAFVTVNEPDVPLTTTALPLERAVLSERGFSRCVRESPDGPEVFVHDDVQTDPRWEDVPGLVTRLGDVTELLKKTDDRWVAFKGGDAIRLTYDATRLPPLQTGFARDFVLVSDGWDKDFDKNTVTGESVAPYPFHAMSAYPYPDAERFPDPAFLSEWLTRRAGPEAFRDWVRAYRAAR
jgi:hypothetical protein